MTEPDRDVDPMTSGTCPDCGEEFCNHGGRCYACLNRAEVSQ